MASRSRSTQRFPHPAPSPRGNARRRFRPSLMMLEPRTMLATLTVSNLNDGGSGSLRGAIGQAKNGDTIDFASSLFGGGQHQTITLTSGALNIATDVTIYGPGVADTDLLTIDGNHNSTVMTIPAGTDVTVSGVILADGKSTIAGDAGAIVNDGTLNMYQCTISGNTARAGGGIYNKGTVHLYGCSVSGNTATNTAGGGITNFGTLSLNQCTVANNSANGSGGGIFNDDATLKLVGCTVAGNSAGAAAGINNDGGTATLDNTIVAANAGGDVSGPVSGSSNLIGGNPKLGPLGDYGGPTPTMALLPGSPAIGTGATTVVTDDQRGFALDSPVPDIGAFQTQPGIVVNTKFDGHGSPLADLSLRQAINLAAVLGGSETITFVFDLTGTIALTVGALQANTGTATIAGPGDGLLTIDAHNASGILSIGAGDNLTISGLILANGSASRGGAIENQGTLTMTDCTVSGSSAIVAGGIDNSGSLTLTGGTVSGNSSKYGGGGLYNDGTGKMTLTDYCNLSGNTAQSGGGAIVNENGMLTLTNSTISGNIANGDGGGILNDKGTTYLYGCTVSGNTSNGNGGGVANAGAMLKMTGCIISGNISDNTATGYGGGISNDNGTMYLSGCTVSGNTANGNGGGVANAGATLKMTGCIISGNISDNTAEGYGGGISNDKGRCTSPAAPSRATRPKVTAAVSQTPAPR